MNDIPLTNVLLKAKIYASRKKDKQLIEWVENELKGYENTPPLYRILDAGVKVDIHRGFQIVTNFEYPIDMITDTKIRERLYHMPIHSSLPEIEEFLHSSESSTIQMDVPVAIWHKHMRHCISGHIQRAYQYASIASLRKIFVNVKSLLIEYFLKIDKDETFNFAQFMENKGKDVIIDNSIVYKAAIVNTGSGSIHATNVSNTIGDGNIAIFGKEGELQRIVDEMKTLLEPTMNDDCKEIITDIEDEISSDTPRPKFIKRCFQALKNVDSEVSTTIVADKVVELIEQALTML